uniref:Uncharacterized protein n=1 Tax=Pyxicephalus adspersus TaxID=30357 RepID=A0AAV2ZT04_PYXAD|nr:TPA: hypothetical protein GDO54_018155 [Pyxicephalus adspersus]
MKSTNAACTAWDDKLCRVHCHNCIHSASFPNQCICGMTPEKSLIWAKALTAANTRLVERNAQWRTSRWQTIRGKLIFFLRMSSSNYS